MNLYNSQETNLSIICLNKFITVKTCINSTLKSNPDWLHCVFIGIYLRWIHVVLLHFFNLTRFYDDQHANECVCGDSHKALSEVLHFEVYKNDLWFCFILYYQIIIVLVLN